MSMIFKKCLPFLCREWHFVFLKKRNKNKSICIKIFSVKMPRNLCVTNGWKLIDLQVAHWPHPNEQDYAGPSKPLGWLFLT